MQSQAQLKQEDGGAAPGLEPGPVAVEGQDHAAKPEANERADCPTRQRCEGALHVSQQIKLCCAISDEVRKYDTHSEHLPL